MPTSAALYLGRGKANVFNDDGSALPLVQPLSAQAVHDRFGVNAIPNAGSSVYQRDNPSAVPPITNQSVWTARVDAMGVYVRGLFDEHNPGCLALAAKCRAMGIPWLMELVDEAGNQPTDRTVAQTTARVNFIADNWADICKGLEGLNEPNQNRNHSDTVPLFTPGWQNVAYDHQAAIWAAAKGARNAAVLGQVPIIGPSLHDARVLDTKGNDYKLLASTGIKSKMNRIGIHKYPAGNVPETGFDTTLGYMHAAFGADQLAWITETGYTNAVARPSGHKPVSQLAAGIYAPRSVLGLCGTRELPVVWYEFLDDVDSGAKDQIEANFGLIAVTATTVTGTNPGQWTNKPAYTELVALLTALDDPGPSYTPAQVGLKIETTATDVRAVVTAKRNGAATLWMWREKPVYSYNEATHTGTDLTVPTVSVTVTDQVGARTVNVGASVSSLALR